MFPAQQGSSMEPHNWQVAAVPVPLQTEARHARSGARAARGAVVAARGAAAVRAAGDVRAGADIAWAAGESVRSARLARSAGRRAHARLGAERGAGRPGGHARRVGRVVVAAAARLALFARAARLAGRAARAALAAGAADVAAARARLPDVDADVVRRIAAAVALTRRLAGGGAAGFAGEAAGRVGGASVDGDDGVAAAGLRRLGLRGAVGGDGALGRRIVDRPVGLTLLLRDGAVQVRLEREAALWITQEGVALGDVAGAGRRILGADAPDGAAGDVAVRARTGEGGERGDGEAQGEGGDEVTHKRPPRLRSRARGSGSNARIAGFSEGGSACARPASWPSAGA